MFFVWSECEQHVALQSMLMLFEALTGLIANFASKRTRCKISCCLCDVGMHLGSFLDIVLGYLLGCHM